MNRFGYLFFTALLFLCSFSFAGYTVKLPTMDASDSCYVISNVDELYGFAKIVNDGVYKQVNGKYGTYTEKGACGKLTADITVNEHVLKDKNGNSNINEDGTYIDRKDFGEGYYSGNTPENEWMPLKQFSGSFHGQGHVIRGLYTNKAAEYSVGFIGSITAEEHDKIVIDNLGIEDSYFRGKAYAGTFFGDAAGSTSAHVLILNIRNCYADAFVVANDGVAGGLTGYILGYSVVTVDNSYFATTVNAKQMGSVVGKIELARSVQKTDGVITSAVESSDASFNNVYYVKQGDVPSYTNTSTKYVWEGSSSETEEFAITGGSVSFLLSGDGVVKGLADGSVAASLHNYSRISETNPEDNVYGWIWGQQGNRPDFSGAQNTAGAVNSDLVKTLDYCTVSFFIGDKLAGEIYVKRDALFPIPDFAESDYVVINWYVDESLTGTTIPSEFRTPSSRKFYGKVLEKDADGFVQIGNLDDLNVFANVVNGNKVRQNSFINGKLTVDLDMSSVKWAPMGTADKPFRGKFVGQGYTISNFKMNQQSNVNKEGDGFFGVVGDEQNEVSIEDVRFVNAYVYLTNYEKNVGVLVGEAKGPVSIKNVVVEGTARGSSYVGALIGKAANVVNVENVGVVGFVGGGSYVGGLVGGFADKSAAKVYVGGSLISASIRADYYVRTLVGESIDDEKLTVAKCVYVPSSGSSEKLVVDSKITPKDSASLKNGEIAVILHNYVNADDKTVNGKAWEQNTVTDENAEADPYPYLVAAGEVGEIVFPLAFEKNGGTFAETVADRYTYGVGYVFPNITREHYTFKGWFSNEACSGSVYTQLTTLHNGAKKFYAKWEPEQYVVTVTANDLAMGSVSMNPVSEGGTYAYGTEITLTATAAEGYRFSNWEDDLNALAERTITVSETKTYTANFEKIPEPASSSSSAAVVIPGPDPESQCGEMAASAAMTNGCAEESSSSSADVVIPASSSSEPAAVSSSSVVPNSSSSVIPSVVEGSSSSMAVAESSSSSANEKQSSSSIKAEEKPSSSSQGDDIKQNSSSSSVQETSSSSAKADDDKSSNSNSESSSSSKAEDKSSSNQKTESILTTAVPQFALSVANRNIQIAGAAVGSAYAILDMQGRVMVSGRVESANFNVPMTRSGNYFVRIGSLAKMIQIP